MGKRKNVTIKVPTATAEAKALPPKIITVKNFLRWNLKYIGLTWASTVAIALIGCFLPWPLSPKFSIVLSIVPSPLLLRYSSDYKAHNNGTN